MPIGIIKYEVVPNCGSFEVSDGQPSRYFYFEDVPGRRLRSEQMTMEQALEDGEAVLLGVDGISDFDGLHSRKHNEEVQFYAFDMLVSDGNDIRKLPLSMRKANLSRLLARRVDGIFLSDFEQGEIGPDLYRHACLMGLEGLVSKHKDRAYRVGRSPHWIKVKNPKSPAMSRAKDSGW